MNILVTGSNGQLGRCLHDIVKKNGNGLPNNFVLDKNYWLFTSHKDLDITDKDAVEKYLRENKINVVVNCAAYTNVEKAESEIEEARKVNTEGARNLANACKNVAAVLIHVSTDYVFDGSPRFMPYSPEDECNPLNVYGKTKRDGELAIIESGCRYLIFRTSWLYSQYEKNFLTTIYNKALNGENISVVADQTSSPTSALSLSGFLYHIIEDSDSKNRYLLKTGIYHYTDAVITSWYFFAKTILLTMKKLRIIDGYSLIKCETKDYQTKAKRPQNSVLSICELENFDVKLPKYKELVKTTILKIEENKKKERERKAAMDAENTEYNYGHNIKYTSNEN